MSTTARTYLPTSRKIGLDIIRYRVGRALVPFLLTLGLLVTLMPFLWTILSSFKTQTEIIRVPPTFWPENPTLDNYRTILQDEDLQVLRFYANSTIVAVCNVLSTLFTSALLGFLFAKYEFRGKRVFFGWFMLGMMIPGVVTMIPDYMILVKLRLANKLAGLIVLSALDAFGIFMMRQFIETIPNELLDAARIDGASEWRIFQHVILPQLGPPLATLGTLNFMGNWNAYLWPMIVITSKMSRTLPIILTWYESQHSERYNLVLAAVVMMVVPILFAYVFFQRWIVRGFTMSGFK
jgi:multiple sugar transport system permease protein